MLPFYLYENITIGFLEGGLRDLMSSLTEEGEEGKLKLFWCMEIRQLRLGTQLEHCLKRERAYFHLQLKYSPSWQGNQCSRSLKQLTKLSRSKKQGMHAPVLLTFPLHTAQGEATFTIKMGLPTLIYVIEITPHRYS